MSMSMSVSMSVSVSIGVCVGVCVGVFFELLANNSQNENKSIILISNK
jgi:hypothetical protein